MKKLLSFILALILCLSLAAPAVTFAATTPVLNKSTLTIHVGEASNLVLTDASDTIIWTSSDATIATVSTDGVVTAVAEGQAVITATCQNQNYTCAVTVKSNKTVDIISTAYIFDNSTIEEYAKQFLKENPEYLDAKPYGKDYLTLTMYESDRLDKINEYEQKFKTLMPSLIHAKSFKGVYTKIKANKQLTKITIYANKKKYDEIADGLPIILTLGILSDSVQSLYLIAPEDRKYDFTILDTKSGKVLYTNK